MEKVEQVAEIEKNVANMPEPDIEFIRLGEVVKLFGVSRATFDRWQRPDSEYYIPDFPKKIKMGNLSFYVRSEIRAYMQKMIDES
ncbi:helix-turn-helix transcriptional regulator [Ursidibacter arcticus]|uniref:helix-turn-helix transcriptional regulator n=1 Tax=Ursidibacter arcticus TaxID=1524965 RepID=UPI001F07B133|nr:AlpA family phage regulatory protein [Ursidibacter arcticus]